MSSTKLAESDKDVGSETEMQKTGKHKPALAVLICITAMVFLIVMSVNYLSSSPVGQSSGMFLNNTGEVSDLFYLEITPAGWTFSIWGFIYTWQIVWLIYVIVNIFRRNSTGEFIYVSPDLETPVFYVLYLFNMGCNITWIFMFDRKLVGWSLLPIALLPVSLVICLVISHRRLMQNGNYMMKIGMNKDIWMTRFFVQNGLAFYATWVCIATLLNVAMLLTYRLGVDQSTACTVSLSILAVEIVTWVILDILVFEKYTRYLFSPHIVVNFALIGSLAKNYTPGKTNSIFTVVLLSVALSAAVLKTVMLFYRHKTRPLFSNNVKSDIDMAFK